MREEVAGNIQIVRFHSPSGVNHWLQENPDVEVLDMQLSISDKRESFMIVYRPENN